jgi:hypothetical protein
VTRAGSLSRDDNGYTVRDVVELPANSDDVWSALIEPTRLELRPAYDELLAAL